MRLSIKAKFVGILVVAAVLPIFLGLAAVWILGSRHFLRERGHLFQAGAAHLASSLNQSILYEVEQLTDWLSLAELPLRLAHQVEQASEPADGDFRQEMARLDARWPTLPASDPILRAVLTNQIAVQLSAYQERNSLFAEIFITDRLGQLVASTDKTSDFYQADETWWQRAAELPAGEIFLQGIVFDESAGVYSVDVAVPLRVNGTLVGVAKGVINLMPLFASLQPIITDRAPVRELIREDGQVLATLLRREIRPVQREWLPAEVLSRLRHDNAGWCVAELNDNGKRLMGFAAIEMEPLHPGAAFPTGAAPMHVVVHEDLAVVLAPVLRYLRFMAGAGALCLLGFVVVGYRIATQRIIAPVQTLQTAARVVAESTEITARSPETLRALNRETLRRVETIRSGDELESLARDFLTMAGRVLQYHEQLRDELAIKTAAIQRDLDIAREFQEALMPREYPKVPPSGATARLQLQFQHFYRPASSVGGDFFDVLKLNDHCAGIFIADVMGHGARSALITAILRAFLQELSPHAHEPAAFLGELNRQFSRIIAQSSQFIFVSACYLVLDTERSLARYASAGHPAPLRAGRHREKAEPLYERLADNPALGLFPNSVYQDFKRTLEPGDVFLLYTDGVTEAQNPAGEEFGLDRLVQAIARDGDRGVMHLTEAVLAAVDEFRGQAALADDICLVACEVQSAPATSPTRVETQSASA